MYWISFRTCHTHHWLLGSGISSHLVATIISIINIFCPIRSWFWVVIYCRRKASVSLVFLQKDFKLKVEKNFVLFKYLFFCPTTTDKWCKNLHNWENFVNISPKICCLTFISNQCVGQLTSRLFHEKQGPAEPGVNCF